MKKPVVLCVLDGWGWRADEADNAIALANTPHWDKLLADCPHAFLKTDGLSVGLPEGQMGNSEVGHLTIGAGRVVYQDLPKITHAIETGELAQNPALLKFIAEMKESGGTVHLMGLTSPGGVHAHQDHILALAKILTEAKVPVALHIITDGRDVPPQSAAFEIKSFVNTLPGGAKVATLSGRYYAMDRDKRWERIELAYRAMAEAKGERFTDVVSAIEKSYAGGVHDEFIVPWGVVL
jgi:2,3-bisphosphoglycerate-independent phosphoglycerate mutase